MIKEFRRLPAALYQQDQPGEQELAEQEEALPAAPAKADEAPPDFPPKMDITRAVLFDWQAGQETCLFSCREKNRVSKIFPHFLHLNS
jgi:hypothetical protein